MHTRAYERHTAGCRNLVLAIALALSFMGSLRAQVLEDTVHLNFRQSKTNIDSTYMDNAEELRHAISSVAIYNQPDSGYVLSKATVVGAASPEGSVRINEWLSRQRAARIIDFMGNRTSLPDSLTQFTYLGRDWSGLRDMVTEDANVPYREDVLSTLEEIIRTDRHGEKEEFHNLAKMKRLHGGIPYRYMYTHLFPTLRQSTLVLTYSNSHSKKIRIPEMPEYINTSVIEILHPELQYISFEETKECKPFYMGLKTNMLFDALAVPNIGAEFYLGKNLSIVGNWMYGWWDKDRTHHYWRIYGGDIALRWWFGKKAHEKPLTGHYLGVYGGVVTYDFEFGGKGQMGGLPHKTLWDRCNSNFGVEYGYSLPIARRLNIDFTLGLGYLSGKYIEYVPKDRCYVWQATKKRNYYGPTKLEISLVWLLGCNNYNVKKGGRK